MSDENLGEGLNESYRQHKRAVAIKHLGERPTLTLAQIAKLVSHDEHGDVVGTITLQELLTRAAPDEDADEPAKSKAGKTSAAAAVKKGASKSRAAAAAKKGASKPKASAAKKASAPKGGAAKGPKADKGKPKPRLDYDQGMREVLAALKAAKAAGHDSLGRSAIEEATGFTGVQVRAFAKKLAASGKLQILGEGGRSTTYALA